MAAISHYLDRVIQDDCVKVMGELPAGSVDLIFADPPYNMQLGTELWRPNNTKVDPVDDHWDQFASFKAYDDFTRQWLLAARRVLRDTGTIWVIGTYHNIYRVGAIMMDIGFWILNDVVWIKANPTPQMRGVRFCNAHETLLWAKGSKEAAGYTFQYKAMKAANEDKQMRSDWYFPICGGSERRTVDGSKAHTTQKPEALLRRVITSSSGPGDIVLDPFCGTGTTAAVAKRLDRRFITIDRESEYVRVARQRIDAVTTELVDDASTWVDAPPPRISFGSLVETGVISAGTELRLRPGDAIAHVNSDGSISMNGFRGSIHKIAAKILEVPSCNGWTHWYFRDDKTGEFRVLDSIRSQAATQDEMRLPL